MGGPDRCLNPQPDLPSCHSASPGVPPASGGTSASASAGAGPVTGVPSVGGFGAGLNVGSDDAGLPGDQVAGSSGDFAGAGGETALETAGGGNGGASAGTGGAAAGTGAVAGRFAPGP